MKTAWLTYAWKDNEQGDVDYLAQELELAGVTVKLDRWNISAGRRLWEQIDTFITEPSESDGWVMVATANSLQSEPCKEEFAYALNRALKTRGGVFPVIGIFLGPIEQSLIPRGLSTRLYVSITDPDWKERVVASLEGRQPSIERSNVDPYHLRVFPPDKRGRIAIEVRPRAGYWQPFYAAIPAAEKDDCNLFIMPGPPNAPTDSGALLMCGDVVSDCGDWTLSFAGIKADPTTSYYLWFDQLPSVIIFGTKGTEVGEGSYAIKPQ